MVGDLAKLTQSLRSGFVRNQPTPGSSPAVLAAKRLSVQQELRRTGNAIYVDEQGNRFRIEVHRQDR